MKAVFSSAISAMEKTAFVFAPVFYGRSEKTVACALLASAGVLAAGGGWLRRLDRIALRAELYARANRALLRTRSASLPNEDPLAALMDGAQQGAELAADIRPRIAGGAIGGLVGLVLLAVFAPLSIAVGYAVLAVATAGFVVSTRGLLARSIDREWRAQKPVLDASEAAVFAREEIVAGGAAEAHASRLEERLAAWKAATVRTEGLSTWLARAPLALLSAAAVFPFVSGLVPAPSGFDVALVVAVSAVLLGAIRALHEGFRAKAASSPLARVLASPPCPEGTAGAPPVGLAVERVSFGYEAAAPVLVDVSFSMDRGSVLVVEGPNGAGKSTLLRLLAGLEQPTSGTIGFRTEGGATTAFPERTSFAYLPQRVHLPRFGTIDDAFSLAAPKSSEAERKVALAKVGLDDERGWLARPIGELSSGQRQRVALARLLARAPSVVVLDEPDGWLDADGIALVADLVALWRKDAIVILAAHRLELTVLADMRVDLSRATPPRSQRRAAEAS